MWRWVWLCVLLSLLDGCLAYKTHESSLASTNVPLSTLCSDVSVERNSARIHALSQALLKSNLDASCAYLDSPYGIAGLAVHAGIDFPQVLGTPVYSVSDGQVVKAIATTGHVAVRLNDQRLVVYEHLNTLAVSAQSKVLQGQLLGTVGMKGFATAPHVHIEVRVNYPGCAALAGISCGGQCHSEQIAKMTANPVDLMRP